LHLVPLTFAIQHIDKVRLHSYRSVSAMLMCSSIGVDGPLKILRVLAQRSGLGFRRTAEVFDILY
jgi:hypothetical protein